MAENLENTNVEQGQDSVTETENEKGRYYTEEEIAMLEQKAGDKRISQYQKTLDKKNREAEKLRNMSDTEKFEYELSQREAAIAEKEKQLALAEMTNTASKILAEKGLSLDLVSFVVDADGDVTNANIKRLEKAFKASVSAEVTKRIGGTAPVKPATDPESITLEQFKRMSLREKQDLYNTHPEVFKALTN